MAFGGVVVEPSGFVLKHKNIPEWSEHAQCDTYLLLFFYCSKAFLPLRYVP